MFDVRRVPGTEPGALYVLERFQTASEYSPNSAKEPFKQSSKVKNHTGEESHRTQSSSG